MGFNNLDSNECLFRYILLEVYYILAMVKVLSELPV